MSLRIYNTLNKNPSLFRYWGNQPRQVMEQLYYGTALGKKLGIGTTIDSLTGNNIVVDSKDKPLFEDKITPKITKNVKDIYSRARGAANFFGYSVFGFFEFPNTKDEVLYWLEDTHITELEVLPGTRTITKLSFHNPSEMIDHSSEPITLEKGQLDKVMLLGNYDTRVGKYRAAMEPYHDVMMAYMVHLEQLTVLEIRTGSGTRTMKAPKSFMDIPANRTKINNMMENWGVNTIFAYPDGLEEQFEFTLDFGDGAPPFNHREAGEEILKPVSIGTGLPYTYLVGEMTGLRSAEENQNNVYDFFIRTRDEAEEYLLAGTGWLIEEDLSEAKNKWMPNVEIDEEKKLAMKITAYQAFQDMLPDIDGMGFKAEDIIADLGIEIEFDQASFDKAKTLREELKAKISEGMSDGSEPDDTQEEETNEDNKP